MRDRTPSRPSQLAIATPHFTVICKWLAFATLVLLLATLSPAQTETPFLFARTPVSAAQDGIITLLRDPNSGVVTLLPAPTSTFAHPCIPEAMEPEGQFLFGVCGDGLAMYSFNSTSGAIQEISTSPYAISTTGYSFIVAPESTGQFVYLLKFAMPTPSTVSYVLDTFQIDRITPQLVPMNSQPLPFGSLLVGAAADPNGHGIVVVTTEVDSVSSATRPMAFVITFDPTTGLATVPTGGITVLGTEPTAFALSPQGKYFALGSSTTGFNVSEISSGATIHYTADGSTPTISSPMYAAPFTLTSATTVQAIATASGYTASPVASVSFKVQTAAGNYTIVVTPTAVANNSSKQLPMNPISLSLTVK